MEPTRDALLEFVRSGKGLVVYHHAAASFQDWGEFKNSGRMVSASPGRVTICPYHYKVEIRDTDHPITRGLAPFMARTDDSTPA